MTGDRKDAIKIKRDRTRLYQPLDDSSASAASSQVRPGSPAPVVVSVPAISIDATRRGAWDERGIVSQSVVLAMSAGLLVPIPVLDTLTVFAIQLRMLSRLAAHHGRSFDRERARSVIGSLVAGMPMLRLSWLKAVPGAGTTAGAASVSFAAGAVTYALGRVFSAHFAGGGTLPDFSPEVARARFQETMGEGREFVRRISSRSASAAS